MVMILEQEQINELRQHHDLVQSNIDEILINQTDSRLCAIELKAVIDGYSNYLKRKGFGGLEVPMILAKLNTKLEY